MFIYHTGPPTEFIQLFTISLFPLLILEPFICRCKIYSNCFSSLSFWDLRLENIYNSWQRSLQTYINFTCRDAETGEFYHRTLQPIPIPDLISSTVEVNYTIYYNCICTTFKLGLNLMQHKMVPFTQFSTHWRCSVFSYFLQIIAATEQGPLPKTSKIWINTPK